MIADHEKEEDEINTLVDDWIFFALVIDRILLVFFGIVCLLGSFGLFYRYANYYFFPSWVPTTGMDHGRYMVLPAIAQKSLERDIFA